MSDRHEKIMYTAEKRKGIRIWRQEQLREKIQEFNLLSDIFMRVALKEKDACQYVIRLLLDKPDLVVKEVRTQYRVSRLVSRDVILDILAEDSEGVLYNLEIQRAKSLDHARRTRLYGAMVDSEYLEKGKTYEEMPDVFILYISEKNLWETEKAVCPVSKYLCGKKNRPYDDGIHVIYINAEIDDGTEAARLMQYFKTADPEDMSHGALSRRVHALKREEGGWEEMCKVSEEIYGYGLEDGRNEGIELGRSEGIELGRSEGIELGRSEGMELGRSETRRNITNRLYQEGFQEEKIAEVVGETLEKVREWLRKE